MNPLAYLNPLSNQFPDIKDQFKKLDFWPKVGVIAATALAAVGSFFILGLGGVAAFRFTVKSLSSSEYSAETEKTDDLGISLLIGEEEQSKQKEQMTTLFEGTRTQYDPKYSGQGRSACTSIALKAAQNLLELRSFSDITPELIDQILDDGVKKYQTRGSSVTEHSTVEEYPLSDYSLQRKEFHDAFSIDGDPYSGTVKTFDGMLKEAEARLDFPTALVITKAPETIVLVCRSSEEFWLFDSHGGSGRKAFVERFDSMEMANAALVAKFPYVPSESDEDALLMDMTYNSFNAYAVNLMAHS